MLKECRGERIQICSHRKRPSERENSQENGLSSLEVKEFKEIIFHSDKYPVMSL